MYSGRTAARAYALLKGEKFDAVVIVGPSHHSMFNGVTLFDGSAYQTPIGLVPINKEVQKRLLENCDCAFLSDEGHREEHSIEVQLPFLQRILGDFSFVPVPMGEQSFETCKKLANGLVKIGKEKNILFVASSDLSHYHPYARARELDRRVMEKIEKYDIEGLHKLFESGSAEACGAGPIMTIMMTAKELNANQATIVHSCNSGDVAGNRDAVVGYLSAVFSTVPSQ